MTYLWVRKWKKMRLKGENIVYDAHQPFDLILKSTDEQLWRYLVEAILNHEVEFSTGVQVIKTVCSSLNIEIDKQ